ncbi:hypothetical protein LTR10_015174 [Elasticomyces elasticus]|uniref:Uncharacterized protein n=1 Tax=Exophiala sideris TaxID=1016849 RepID=A0ABR0JE02_9EURO|nr:hypothetical protein LTR10_015174 [Elasticomyces elasticus]KAK5032648.1 hypothetical protein LTS07_004058 [Exophiala sideris]KAK5037171.1 hypothetical protein LTR13_004976 [Exophiala sideris]KAK5062173.1 hypothetical protein LTR69_004531 [Exophiala sideris]KAK5182329.1 hypothetical protein LTR44_005340 [Eurotiomycetes sp. CCFEE 6388]
MLIQMIQRIPGVHKTTPPGSKLASQQAQMVEKRSEKAGKLTEFANLCRLMLTQSAALRVGKVLRAEATCNRLCHIDKQAAQRAWDIDGKRKRDEQG